MNMVQQFEFCMAKGGAMFGKTWLPFSKRLMLLSELCRALATVFPGTATAHRRLRLF